MFAFLLLAVAALCNAQSGNSTEFLNIHIIAHTRMYKY